MCMYSHICTTASSHVGEEKRRLWQRTLRTKNDSSRLWDLGKKGPLLVSADFSIFCTACRFTGKMSHMADLYVIFLGVTFLSSISYCYFQAECTPNRIIYMICGKIQCFLGAQLFYLLYRTAIFRQNTYQWMMIFMICGKTQSIQKIEILYISRNSTTVFGVVTFLSIFGTLYIYILTYL